MKIPSYNIEYTWKKNFELITLVIISKLSRDEELIAVNDEIYSKYNAKFGEVEVYYFDSGENATKYVYDRLVEDTDNESKLVESKCIGNLLNHRLFSRMSPPRLIKTYKDIKVHLI